MIDQAVILCGGLGTRLGTLTAETPKPLLPVGDAPFLDILLFELGRHGFRRILLLAGFAAGRIEEYAAATPIKARFGLEIDIAVEPELAGTGGALWHARDRLDPAFLLANGDSWFDINLRDLVSRLARDPGALGMLSLRQLADASRYGAVRLAGDQIVEFAARPTGQGSGLVSAGVYALRRSVVEALGRSASLEADLFPRMATAGQLRGAVGDGYFVDIGVPNDLARARREIPQRRHRPAVFLNLHGAVVRRGDQGPAERLRWIAGVPAAVKALNDAGMLVFLVTDQSVVTRGLHGEGIDRLHPDLTEELAVVGGHVDDARYCPPVSNGSGAEWREPAAVFLDLLRCWPVDISTSFMVGDRNGDLPDAGAAGIADHRFPGGDFALFTAALLR